MNKISEITRRDIYDLFRNGLEISSGFLGDEKIIYHYYGRLSEIAFLRRLYPLEQMDSFDPKSKNADDDIWQHTVNNPNDWPYGWIFEDERFPLKEGSDEDLLRFLCEVFHPAVRYEEGYWKEYLRETNNFIRADGYELYESDKISNRYVYSWRQISIEESQSNRFIPFSLRNKKVIDEKTIILPSISKKNRTNVINLFNWYDETLYRTTETNWNYTINIKDAVIEDLKDYYTPKAFDSSRNYVETVNLDDFIMNNYPYCVFDAIELFEKYNKENNFTNEVNLIFQNSSLAFRLLGGKIESSKGKIEIKQPVKEYGLKELLEQAVYLYNDKTDGNKQLAVEKLWDAFERLKTYYKDIDKKKSVEKIINEISHMDVDYITLLDEEFKKLTTIGNNYRIRHHETGKIDIYDNNFYDYFFQRCLALIELSLKYLK